MNYQRIHDQIIERAKLEDRKKGCGVYYERHHIVPRSLGGTNNQENLVLLTAREHFIVHKLLCEIYPDNNSLQYAYHMMAYKPQTDLHARDYKITSNEYQRIKTSHAKLVSETHTGKILSDKTKQKLSKIASKRKLSDETKQKISVSSRTRRHSVETKQKIGDANRGRKLPPLSEEHRKIISENNKKRTYLPISDETREKLSKALKGRVPWNKGVPRSEETKQKIREAHLKRNKSK